MLELQYFVVAFFRRFDAAVASTMEDDDMVMTDGFSGGPAGEKLELVLHSNSSSYPRPSIDDADASPNAVVARSPTEEKKSLTMVQD